MLIEFVKGIGVIVALGTVWLLIQTAHRRHRCQMEGRWDDDELPSCSGCQRTGGCHKSD